ncbi:5-(carboxyamino)imidazole ribonucleotide synthase [Granulosicoccus antarcticus]|uniref:N5-carboxyaminoimidazole ribonucleotide synthase n=1 Tax=Granulosicoccus antarcticus IMCC3135 TaxID=1192854 RepID=A0A2Z2NWR6_9GAMM|nr:5-(carboxyamino)imidazole ribonucleotide synthase [Granulosicoccus antarcticus]ASJ71604.1 N5-carboxyaminoimidazole ribonucleotide synthase [Granulosicoccus antarcticus IMCC3135]
MTADSANEALQPLLPGATIGVVGGGQLGRYFVLEARRLGYHTWVLDPDANAPAMQLTEHKLVASYDDADALTALGEACDAVTVEFENVPAESLEQLARHCRVAPGASSIRIAQDRNVEKAVASQHGLQPVPFAPLREMADISPAVATVGLPAIVKTARLGYDGKGQIVCQTEADVKAAFISQGQTVCVLEKRIELVAEVSVVLARGYAGDTAVFPIAENVHVNGILSTSTLPASLDEALLERARQLALQLANGLDYHGVLAVEFFIDSAGEILFNEMAPRPHNSGHYTLDATVCSQFEQQLRALCGLPLGSTQLLSPVCMLNLLGDVWTEGEPRWSALFEQAGVHLHLYGKAEARPGRKMGHVNCLAETRSEALALAELISRELPGRK